MTVLLVEDDEPILEALEIAFETEDIPCVGVSSGEDAVAWYRTNEPSLVVLDMMLPDMTGPETAAALRAIRPCRILVITADGRAEQKAAAIHADGVVQKPFDLKDFFQTVRQLA